MANQFKPGDTVNLKSGGPKMTVVKVDEEHCVCTWFDDKKKLEENRFPSVVLISSDEHIRATYGLG